jgi:hypothetical protein
MHQIRISLTDEQFELIAHMADSGGEAIEDVIPELIDEYISLVRYMDAQGRLPGPDHSTKS